MGNSLRNFGFSISLRMSGGVDFVPSEPETNNNTNERVVVVEASEIREGRFQGHTSQSHSRGCPNRNSVRPQSILGDPPVSQPTRSHNPRSRPPPYSNTDVNNN